MFAKLEIPLWISVIAAIGCFVVWIAAAHAILTYIWSPADGIKGAALSVLFGFVAGLVFFRVAQIALLILSVLIQQRR